MNGLMDSGLPRQDPVEITRLEAEIAIQQRYGPIIGIGKMTDEDLEKQLSPQFRLARK